jgi:hypothetical protein
MRVKKIIREIAFVEPIRDELTLGPGVRMDPDTERLQLKESPLHPGDRDIYPTDLNLYAITPLFNPNSVKKWVGFDAYVVHAYDEDGAPITGFNYRLSDGIDQYWWDGSDWVANDIDWNTEEDVSSNIATWPANAKKIQIVINPYTTDGKYTPVMEKIKLLYDSDIEFQEDLLARTIIPYLRDNLRPLSELLIEIEAAAPTDQIAFSDYSMETGYDLVGVDSVFDETNDPDHFENILDSYDAGTEVITLTRDVADGDAIWVNFLYRPLVAISTDSEYSEDARVPAVHITDVDVVNEIESFQSDYVRSKGGQTAIKIPSAVQRDLSVSLEVVTNKSKDLHRLGDEIRTFFKNNRMVTSMGMDEKYPTMILSDFSVKTGINENTLHFGFFRFGVLKALFYQEKDETAYVVIRFNINGDVKATIN